jgi:hypothetical protein
MMESLMPMEDVKIFALSSPPDYSNSYEYDKGLGRNKKKHRYNSRLGIDNRVNSKLNYYHNFLENSYPIF